MKKRTSFGLIDFENKSTKEVLFMKLCNNNKIFFRKMIGVISGKPLKRVANKYNSDYRTQSFFTDSHVYSMLFFNFKGLDSLHDLHAQVVNNTKLNSIIQMPSISQFSRKNKDRDYRVFEDLFYYLVDYTKRQFGMTSILKDLPPLKIIDSTMITLSLELAECLKYDNSRSAVKISTLFNGEYPEKVHIVRGNTNDRKCVDNFFEDKGSIYVFDRGYYSYRFYDKLTENKIKFVTRGIDNAIVMEEKLIRYYSDEDIYDTEVILGSTPGGNLGFNKLREIMFFDEENKPIYLVTNIFNLDAKIIIQIYKRRWDIELFFKWVKQNLRVKKCIGYNENSIKIQIYSALIVYLLIYILNKTSGSKISMLNLTRIIKVNLLEQYVDVVSYLKDD